ncbi:MAG: lysostaphin resistance A-like protein [Terriglobales bacterium]
MDSAPNPVSASGPRDARFRLLSAAEFLLGAWFVVGYNVYRIGYNEVPILFLLGLISLRLRDGGWAALGLRRPDSWRRIVLIAVAAATLRIVLAAVVIDPLTERFWPPATAPAGTESITGNLVNALLALGFVWIFAAFGEEIGYHGYLLTRAADLGGRTPAAYWIGLIVVSVLSGYGHYYKGPAGMVDSGIAGFILGAAYLLARRNLWAAILAHGFIDTVAVIAVYFGWDT